MVVGSGDDLLVVELYAAHGTVVAKESVRTCHSLDIPHLHHLRFEPQQLLESQTLWHRTETRQTAKKKKKL